MRSYAPIHPERPVRRAAVAVAVSLGVHAGILSLLIAWTVAALAAARKAEEERPKEVALATVDPGQWERNRVVESPPPLPPPEKPRPRERPPEKLAEPMAPEPPAVELAHPAVPKGSPPPAAPSPQGATSPFVSQPAPAGGGGAPLAGEDGAAAAAEGSGAGPGRPAVDLHPRPLLDRPLAMRFDPVGRGAAPITEGTTFSGFTVQNPEAWRFANFFNRAVESMNSVYRYELGAPVPPSLYAKWVADPRQAGACSYTWVALDVHGRVVEAQVRKSSGMSDLDALIIEVIRRTAPFANLPAGLLDASGAYRDTWGLCIVRGAGRG